MASAAKQGLISGHLGRARGQSHDEDETDHHGNRHGRSRARDGGDSGIRAADSAAEGSRHVELPVLPGAKAHLPDGVRLQPPPGAPVDNQVVEITKKDPVTGELHTVRVPYVAEHQLERESDGSVTDWVVDPPDLMDRVAAAARTLP